MGLTSSYKSALSRSWQCEGGGVLFVEDDEDEANGDGDGDFKDESESEQVSLGEVTPSVVAFCAVAVGGPAGTVGSLLTGSDEALDSFIGVRKETVLVSLSPSVSLLPPFRALSSPLQLLLPSLTPSVCSKMGFPFAGLLGTDVTSAGASCSSSCSSSLLALLCLVGPGSDAENVTDLLPGGAGASAHVSTNGSAAGWPLGVFTGLLLDGLSSNQSFTSCRIRFIIELNY
jgi:hypothetical protein